MYVNIMSTLEYAYMILDLKNINVLHIYIYIYIYIYETICFEFQVGFGNIYIVFIIHR
jgi:hypothetical protein